MRCWNLITWDHAVQVQKILLYGLNVNHGTKDRRKNFLKLVSIPLDKSCRTALFFNVLITSSKKLENFILSFNLALHGEAFTFSFRNKNESR